MIPEVQVFAQVAAIIAGLLGAVERIAEAQRFMARLESERDVRQALPLQS